MNFKQNTADGNTFLQQIYGKRTQFVTGQYDVRDDVNRRWRIQPTDDFIAGWNNESEKWASLESNTNGQPLTWREDLSVFVKMALQICYNKDRLFSAYISRMAEASFFSIHNVTSYTGKFLMQETLWWSVCAEVHVHKIHML